ncbi:MAG: UDP-N-acetylmuramoyl-tripeptide--D-alanyl-D-alanine ligase [Deltaproteobacteria bacterium]|nr:UDP-N-acetylmuramoyl-tripeptide--D-alanyl-D-alanine ligase [Deltaproteobacteria bacterium]
MSAHFTAADVVAAIRGALLQGSPAAAFLGVSTDSRTCQSGQLYVALKGERHDGHDYLGKALERGARGLLVEDRPQFRRQAWDGRVAVIAAPCTLAALGDLARAWRSRFSLPLAAVTGSCGKTTAKEMTARVLSRNFRVLKNELNLNNLIGLPQTLFQLDAGYDAAVVEMGMNRFGEIRRLTEICRPTVGVLLNVYAAHTEGVGDVAGVARAKGELIRALEPGAALVYNADDHRVARQAQDFTGTAVGFGFGPQADLRASDREPRGRAGQTFRLHWRGASWSLTLQVPGLHQVYNALAATAVGLLLGVAPEAVAAQLADFRAIVRRSQVAALTNGVHLLNDCYNANPGSMAMALQTLTELRDDGRAVAALGDMLELGAGAVKAHRELGRLAARAGLDYLVVYGNFREEVAAGAREGGLPAARIHPVESHDQGALALREFLQPGDWLLVKGSRSMRMERLLEALED